MVLELRHVFEQTYKKSEAHKMQSMSDRLFTQFDQKAKDWGEVYNDESAEGRTLLRRRNAYYTARKELADYIWALERTVSELESQLERANGRIQSGQLGQL